MSNGGAWQSNGNSKPSHWLRVEKGSELTKLEARRPSKGMGDVELLSLQPPWLKRYPWRWTAPPPPRPSRKGPQVRNGQRITNQTQWHPCVIETILHWVDSFQGGLWDFHRTGIPVSLGITLRTAISILPR